MAIEGLDAALAIETAGFVPEVAVPESLEPEAAATLEAALAEAGAPPSPGTEASSERLRDEVTLDLWVAEGSRAMAPVLHVGGPYDVSGAQTPDDPLILHKLTIEDMTRAASTGRYGDSTEEYSWWEMTTSDFEWAKRCFMMDVYAGVNSAIQDATTQAQADQLARDYIHSLGLDSVVHLNNPEGEEIIITATIFRLLNANIDSPLLTLDPAAFANLQLGTIGPELDRDNIEIHLDPDVAMTEDNVTALGRLQRIIESVAAYLAGLPDNGVLTTPKGPITVAELRATFAIVDFHITKEGTSYAGNGLPGHPGAGFADYNNGNPIFETSISYLRDLMANETLALYYVLHELAHVTLTGHQDFVNLWANGTPSETAFIASEVFANDVSRILAEATHHPFYPGFPVTFGFSSDSGIIFLPAGQPDPDGGPDGGVGGDVNGN